MFEQDEVQAIVDRRVEQIVAYLKERSLPHAAIRIAAVFGDLPFHIDVPVALPNGVDDGTEIEDS